MNRPAQYAQASGLLPFIDPTGNRKAEPGTLWAGELGQEPLSIFCVSKKILSEMRRFPKSVRDTDLVRQGDAILL